MKHLLYVVLASVFLITSCTKSSDEIESKDLSINKYPQTWKLVKMTGSLEGFESEGEEMYWQETYVFKSDGSFLKTRISEGESLTASGNYVFDKNDQSFSLDYGQKNPIIGSCGSPTKEFFYLREESKILQSSWWACDGPGLFYERIK